MKFLIKLSKTVEKKIFTCNQLMVLQTIFNCLISLGKDQSISQVAKLLKGESSFWINKQALTKEKFAWKDDYFAISVSESKVDAVINYIRNQEAHHSKKSFDEEVRDFTEKYGW